ncbi:hypothetical protein MA16_Dca028106 [Dendrobium catenatum]|uniref:Uncharacterized protein n=1 Tax=Dendrobium catenatum TaxID=906689 RepID=A0A2I0VCN0_9ASPA|nr:hypothetical protein MA16_Dca028106 [Dendrobium catenatum]
MTLYKQSNTKVPTVQPPLSTLHSPAGSRQQSSLQTFRFHYSSSPGCPASRLHCSSSPASNAPGLKQSSLQAPLLQQSCLNSPADQQSSNPTVQHKIN